MPKNERDELVPTEISKEIDTLLLFSQPHAYSFAARAH